MHAFVPVQYGFGDFARIMELCFTGVLAIMVTTATVTCYPDPSQPANDARLGLLTASKGHVRALKPRTLDTLLTTNLLRAAASGAQSLLNPCHLFDFVRERLNRTFQKGKSKSTSVDQLINRQLVFGAALPALREGISLHRALFVLHETSNLTVFLDQNKDDVYADTVLRNYSHYYIRAGNSEMTQILFVGLINSEELTSRGSETPALEFLAANGLANHPRQYIEFDMITSEEATLILEKRQQMAALLATQDLFWENDVDYLTDILTVAFNGPEQTAEFAEMLPKVVKFFNHRLLTSDLSSQDQYDTLCNAWESDRNRDTQIVL